MKQLYLIRLDDACPTMDRLKWGEMELLLDNYCIKPLVGVIPHNEDPLQAKNDVDNAFRDRVTLWKQKGWSIAMHGFNHCYSSDQGMRGMNPMWARSEFAGLPLEEQCEKIRNGISIFREHDIEPHFFFAPSHTFDKNTLEALRRESNIRVISDTIGRFPYKKNDFWFIPQIMGHCSVMPFNGIFTFCFHPNTMLDSSYASLESFLQEHREKFISFDEIAMEKYNDKSVKDRVLSWAFYTYRRLRGLQ